MLLKLVLTLVFLRKPAADEPTNIYSFVVDFRRLQQLEEDIQITVKTHFETLYTFKKKMLHSQPAGSASEGSSFARAFHQKNTNIKDVFYELDVENKIIELPKEYSHCINDLTTKRGFVNFNVTCLIDCKLCEKLYLERDPTHTYQMYLKIITCNNDLFCHHNIKDLYEKGKKGFEEDQVKLLLFAIYYDMVDKGFNVKVKEERTKSSVIRKYEFPLNKEMYAFQLEQAFVIKLQWQSHVMRDWLKRHRNWPRYEDIEKETNEGYIVAKVSKKEKYNNLSTELRYSFGHLERKLTYLRSKHQNLVYLIFKSIFYKWIHPIDTDEMTSYLAKTIMLWTCEQYPPDHVIWNENTNATVDVIRYLLQELFAAFKKGFLPYYFIPEINVIDHVSMPLKSNVAGTIRNILKGDKFLHIGNIEDVIHASEKHTLILKRFMVTINELILGVNMSLLNLVKSIFG